MEISMEILPVEGHELGDVALATRVGEALNRHYPGHLWAVHINDERLGGVLVIRNLAVSFLYGYVLKLQDVYADPSLRCVMRAGGEILERAKMKRDWWDGQDATNIDGVKDKHQPVNGIII
jgi:hypothetical protein